MWRTSVLRVLLVATGISALSLCVANVRVHAAYDAFLKIEGLDGGSKDPAHKGWIAVSHVTSGDLNGEAAADRESSQPSVSELTVRKAGGSGAGKVSSSVQTQRDVASGMPTGRRMHKPLVIVKEADQASPKLFEACASGKHFASVLVETGGKQYKLYDVVITSAQKSSGGDRPTETLSLNFTKIEVVQDH